MLTTGRYTMLNKIFQLKRALLGLLVSMSLIMTLAEFSQAACTSQAISIRQQILTKSAYSVPRATFNYSLKALTMAAPMPNGTSQQTYDFAITANGTVNLCLNLTQAGTFEYELQCKSVQVSSLGAYALDRLVYTITVQVYEQAGELQAYVSQIKATDGYKHDEIIFQPEFLDKPSDEQANLPSPDILPKPVKQFLQKGIAKTGELLESKQTLYLLAALLLCLLLILVYRKKQEQQVEASYKLQAKEEAILQAKKQAIQARKLASLRGKRRFRKRVRRHIK